MTTRAWVHPAVGEADRAAFLQLSSDYLRWHLADVAAANGRVIDVETFVAAEPGWFDGLLADRGLAWLGGVEAVPCGIVALARLGEDTLTKRLYVDPRARGAGLGLKLIESAIEAARAWHARSIRLDSHPRMADATALYRAMGFVDGPPVPGDPLPDWFAADIISLELRL